MRYTTMLIASVLFLVFGAAQACPGDKAGNQAQSGTVSKPLVPKPSA